MNKTNKLMRKVLKIFLIILIVTNLSILIGIFFAFKNLSVDLTYAQSNNDSYSSLNNSEEYNYKTKLLNNVNGALEYLYEVEALNHNIGNTVLSFLNKNDFSGSALSKLSEPLNKLNKLELFLEELPNNINDNIEELIKLANTYKDSAITIGKLIFNNTEINSNILKTYNEQIDISNKADEIFISTITELLDKLDFSYELTDDGINYKLK